MFFKRIAIAVASLFAVAVTGALAQTTRVRGRVTDAQTGEGVSFAGVYFEGSTVGVSADLDGYFQLETRDHSLIRLSASILGYESDSKEIQPGKFNEVRFRLRAVDSHLDAAVVKPDDSYVRSILRKVVQAKPKNDPERKGGYTCDTYSKNEVDLSNPDTFIVRDFIPKDFMFVYDYMDTSLFTGLPYLPVMISEATSRYYHGSSPGQDKEVILSSRVSGIQDQETVAQFTGSMHVKTNFYDNFLNILNVEIPSPIASDGTAYYNYYLVDSLYMEGRKTYRIRFHPSRRTSVPAFDGEMGIDGGDYALRDIHAKLKPGTNVNWVRGLELDVEHQRVGDSTWFYSQDRIMADFSVTMRDSSRMVAVIASRQINFSNPRFGKPDPSEMKVFAKAESVQLKSGVLRNDEEYWEEVRPYPLSDREKGIYEMVDSVRNAPLFERANTLANMLVSGFYNFNYLGIGPYYSFYSFNDIEGSRFQFGTRTTKNFSRKVRLMVYGAYGTLDREVKGGGVAEFMFNNNPTRMLTVLFQHDMMQLGSGSSAFGSGNIMTSVLSKSGGRKMSMVNDYSVSYQHEWSQDVNMTLALESRRIFSNGNVPMVRTDGTSFSSVAYNQARARLRFSKDEIVTRGVFEKGYFYTRYPVVTVDLSGSVKGLGRNDYSFIRPEVSVRYNWLLPPFGQSRIRFNAGAVLGQVPYPMLYLFEGNGTYSYHRNAFACMDHYEFAADRWATLLWEHNFKGFFLGRIPLLRQLQWREVLSLKAGYGTLRDENNGIAGSPRFGAVMLFPEGMKTLEKPYVEMGVGITNIFKVLRIDAYWRMTHRDDEKNGVKVPHDNRFVINFGFEFKL